MVVTGISVHAAGTLVVPCRHARSHAFAVPDFVSDKTFSLQATSTDAQTAEQKKIVAVLYRAGESAQNPKLLGMLQLLRAYDQQWVIAR